MTDEFLQHLKNGGPTERSAAEYIEELEADNARLRRALEMIAGGSTDQLQVLQAKTALANIGPAS